jgi:hypothetical protein
MNLFSNPYTIGIISAVIAGLILYFVFGIGKEKKDSTSVDKTAKFNKITPVQIIKTLDNIPPYQKDDVAKNYKGYRIKWKLQLESAYKSDGRNIRIQASWNGGIRPLIYLSVNSKKYPEFKNMKQGKKFIVEGSIKNVDSIIDLENCIIH